MKISSDECSRSADNERIRYAQQVTAFPAGITTGSTWDTGLMYARGLALGNVSDRLSR